MTPLLLLVLRYIACAAELDDDAAVQQPSRDGIGRGNEMSHHCGAATSSRLHRKALTLSRGLGCGCANSATFGLQSDLPVNLGHHLVKYRVM
jgi:hypothetical protein